MRRLLPLLALPLLVAGCSTRERANPFDPNNPATNGRPSGFVAIAGEGQVQLRWQQVAGNTLTGYQLFRRGPGEAAFRAITPVLNTGVTQFRDVGLLDGQDYTYRLYFVFTGGLGSRPAEDTATPGSAIPWMILSSGSDAFQITPDGRRIANDVTGFTGTIDVAVNAQSGLVWISDPGASRVVALNPTTGVRTAIPVAEPGSIAVDSFDGNAWVCDPTAGLVH
ncbi:MAG: hypothetical protein HY076_07605, partial [Candidatus Eisenbacteria bacterium]|nr:hypothetical protein [Candidatus Eisenbacteria bacterium]